MPCELNSKAGGMRTNCSAIYKLSSLSFLQSGNAMMSAFNMETNSKYVELLGQWGMLIMSFYFGGRTLEKIIDMKSKRDDK